MNVLFLMISFPDVTKNRNLYTDLAEEFQRNGHNVYVATLLEKKFGQETSLTREGELNILRVRCGDMFNVNFIKKGFTTLTIPYHFNKALKKYFSHIKFDLVLYPTPPITFAPVVKFIKNRDKCKSYLILRDIFPQNAKDLGLIKNNLLFYFFRQKERQLYNLSDHIGCMSKGNIDYVLQHNNYVEPAKLEILANWKRVSPEEDVPTGECKKKYGLDGKFLGVFGGNLGIAQELEFLLELAREYREREDIVFLIVGKGTAKTRLANIIEKEQLHNVILKDYLPSDDYENLVKECDVGFINLNRKFTIPNIPSKTLVYFSSAVPILAAIDENTDYGRILEDAQAGLWSITGDLQAYKQNFERLLNDAQLRKGMGANGRKYLLKHWTVEDAYRIIMKHFSSKEGV